MQLSGEPEDFCRVCKTFFTLSLLRKHVNDGCPPARNEEPLCETTTSTPPPPPVPEAVVPSAEPTTEVPSVAYTVDLTAENTTE